MPDRFTAGNSDQQHRDGTARNSGLPRSPPDGSPDADPRAGSASPRPDLGSQPESNGGGSTTRSETGTGGSLHPQHHVTRDKGGGGLLQIIRDGRETSINQNVVLGRTVPGRKSAPSRGSAGGSGPPRRLKYHIDARLPEPRGGPRCHWGQ